MKMDAIKFFKEKKRMCESFGKFCAGCEIYNERCENCNESGLVGCRTFIQMFPEQAVDIVEKWSEEHPQETYLTKLLKHFPNVELNSNGIPTFCPSVLGLENWCEKTRTGNCPCAECWNRPIEEEE